MTETPVTPMLPPELEQLLDAAGLDTDTLPEWSEIEAGDAAGRAKMAELFGGQVKHLPLRDPLTLVPLPQ